MISGGFPGESYPRPTQRPASNSEARKRAGELAFSTSNEPTPTPADPHNDWGIDGARMRAAMEDAWNEGYRAGKSPNWAVNPYMGRAS